MLFCSPKNVGALVERERPVAIDATIEEQSFIERSVSPCTYHSLTSWQRGRRCTRLGFLSPVIIRGHLLESVVVNFLIATGLTVPVARGLDVVVNGMDDVLRESSFLAKTLLSMLAKPLEHTNGRYDFLEAVTCHF